MNIFKLLLENDTEAKLAAWKDKVKKAHPDHASKLQFNGRVEKGADGKSKNLIVAEVPGQDRCFGVFDMDKEEGEALGD